MYKNIIQCKRSKLNILIQTNTWPIPILNQAFHIIMYNGNQEFAEMIRILASAEGIYVDYLNEEHYADDENQLLFIVCEAVSHIIDVYSFDYTVWHGGMIARGDLAIAILAGTRVGKSTFIANFLASEEYQYLSDDIILYDEMENRVIPYPIPLKLRELTYIPRVLHARIIAQGYNAISDEMEYYIPGNVSYDNIKNTYKLGAFIVLDRLETGEGLIKRLPYHEAVKALILNSRKPGNIYIRNMAKSAVKIARSIPVYMLNYVRIDEGMSLVSTIY